MAAQSMQELNAEEHMVLIAVVANVHPGLCPADQDFARGAYRQYKSVLQWAHYLQEEPQWPGALWISHQK